MATLANAYWSQNWTASADSSDLVTARIMSDYDKTIAGRAILPEVPDGSKETDRNGSTVSDFNCSIRYCSVDGANVLITFMYTACELR